MKEYLINFFNEFDYEDKDARYLFCVYEKIAENESANNLLG